MELSLRFEHNGTAHNDLVLRFAGKSWVCDSYYLALDCGLLPEREDASKVRAVLAKLVEQWFHALGNVPDGGAVYLPYDFLDQYTGWLRCVRTGGMVDVCQGWAEVEGWRFPPSATGRYLTDLQGFRPGGPAVEVPSGELMNTIRDLIAQNA